MPSDIEYEKPGELSLLNVGTGDTKISFDPNASPEEISKASILVKDMIRRGYAVLVEVGRDEKGPIYRRAKDFDLSTTEYIVAGLPEDLIEEEPRPKLSKTSSGERRKANAARSSSKRGAYTKRVKAAGAKAVAVGRTAGG